MDEAKRERAKKPEPADAPVDAPIDGVPGVTATDIFPTLDAMWSDLTTRPFFQAYSPDTRMMMKYVLIWTASEVMRTIAFRINDDQSMTVFDEFDKEIQAYDREMQRLYGVAAARPDA